MEIEIYLDTLLLSFIFQVYNRGPVSVVLNLLQDHIISHLKALMYENLVLEIQNYGVYFNMYHKPLKYVFWKKMCYLILSFDFHAREFYSYRSLVYGSKPSPAESLFLTF